MTTTLTFIIVFLLLGLEGYLLWTMHQRVENLAEKLRLLALKVKDGESVIVENFTIVEKRFTKLEHEIKETRVAPHAKEVFKAARKLERSRTDE